MQSSLVIDSGSKKELPVSKVSQQFKSKTDFLNYFKTNLQFYVPPVEQMTKDWLKLILSGEKKLLKLNEVKPVHVGNFAEVSVKNLYSEFAKREEIIPYLPTKMAKGKQIDREYFFNVVNTLFGDELISIIDHAHEQRNSIAEEDKKQDSILMSEEMADAMFKFPFISKCKGRTVHLLKQKSKSRKIMKARKTYSILPKDQRIPKQLDKPERIRPHQEDDAEMANEGPQQRKRIQPTVLEKFPNKS